MPELQSNTEQKNAVHFSWLAVGLFGLLLVQGGYFIWQGGWSEVFVVVTAIGLSLIPYLLQRHFDLASDWRERVGIVVFTSCALVLGEIHKFYDWVWWWDVFLHVFAGVGLAVLGFEWVSSLWRAGYIQAAPIVQTVFVAASASSVLVVWEVYEFTIDQLGWSENLMQPSLEDTMIDLIVGLVGVLFVSAVWYIRYQTIKRK